MAKKTETAVVTIGSLFNAAELTALDVEIGKAVAGQDSVDQAEQSLGSVYDHIVPFYHDGTRNPEGVAKATRKGRKAEAAARFTSAYRAKHPESDDKVATRIFWNGCQRAEIRLGFRDMPTPTPKTGGKSKEKGSAKPTGDAAAVPSVRAATLAREATERLQFIQTHHKVTKACTDDLGKLAGILAALNVELGNAPAVAA